MIVRANPGLAPRTPTELDSTTVTTSSRNRLYVRDRLGPVITSAVGSYIGAAAARSLAPAQCGSGPAQQHRHHDEALGGRE